MTARCTALLAMLCCASFVSMEPADGASSAAVVVSSTVLAATTLDVAAACATGSADVTDFGPIVADSKNTTTADCTIGFGSTNGVAALHVSQADATGGAMWQYSRGALDTSYNGTGIVTTATAAGNRIDQVRALVVQPDRSVVSAGYCNTAATGSDLCITRHTEAGVLDTTFNTTGLKQVQIGSHTTPDDNSNAVALQPDGKIVVAGICKMITGVDDFCAVRLTSAGALDNTFDGDGIVTTAIATGGGADWAYAVAVQPDGKIVVGGGCLVAGTGNDLCLARYTSAGALDTTFNGTGKVTTAVGAGAVNDYIRSIVIQPDGKILVAGYCTMAAGIDQCLARYTTAGALDTTFNATGKVTTPVGAGAAADYVYAAMLQPDGRIVTAGSCDMGATGLDLCVARYTTGGVLDTSFHGTGTATAAVGSGAVTDFGTAMAIQDNGAIVVTGFCAMGATANDICVARFTTAGTLDPTYDTDGITTVAVGAGAVADSAYGIALQPDGRLLIGGTCNMGATNDDFCHVELAAGNAVGQYGGANTWGAASASLFAACLQGVASGAVAQWTVNAGCPKTDGTYWNAIPATASTIATTASPQPGLATVNLRFGLRTLSSQTPGSYTAPLIFGVVAT